MFRKVLVRLLTSPPLLSSPYLHSSIKYFLSSFCVFIIQEHQLHLSCARSWLSYDRKVVNLRYDSSKYFLRKEKYFLAIALCRHCSMKIKILHLFVISTFIKCCKNVVWMNVVTIQVQVWVQSQKSNQTNQEPCPPQIQLLIWRTG